MNMTQIVNNLQKLMNRFSKETFIYDLLLASEGSGGYDFKKSYFRELSDWPSQEGFAQKKRFGQQCCLLSLFTELCNRHITYNS